jgi:hypothetical protein
LAPALAFHWLPTPSWAWQAFYTQSSFRNNGIHTWYILRFWAPPVSCVHSPAQLNDQQRLTGIGDIAVIPLFVCPKLLPKFTTGALALTATGFLTWFIVILSMRHQSNNASYITQSGLGTSGWGQGTAWILGTINSMYAFTGTDGVIHIAEEMHRPGIKLPQIM